MSTYFLKQKMHCVFVNVSEYVVLLLRHKTDVKEDITLKHDVSKNKDIKRLHSKRRTMPILLIHSEICHIFYYHVNTTSKLDRVR